MIESNYCVFRVDSSHNIGTGHVMRCLTLADALREKGCTCQFVCRNHPGNLSALIQEKGYRVTLLPLQEFQVEPYPHHASWVGADWQTDAKETGVLIATLETPPDWLVVDHYGLDARWETSLRPAVGRIFVIDDLADRSHDCDLLLDQNLVANRALRYVGKVPKHAGLMLGPEYALLQPQYADLHLRVPPREGPVRRVLVFFGGADADNLTGRVIAAFLSLKFESVVLEVVINPDSAHAASIRNQVFGYGQIILHERLASLAQVIVRADLAIGAGGATSWERCCLGLPALVITLAENQKPIAEEMQQENLIHWLGHKNEVSEMILAEVMQKLFSAGLPPDWSLRCLNRVDGHGAERVTSFLLLNAQTALKARLARLDDEDLILQWANDPLVRENAFTPDPIKLGTHQSWYRSRLRELDQCRFYIVETLAGFPVGQVRFERSGEAWEIHYGLDARARGQKLGKPLLRAAILALRSSTNEAPLFGRVKGSNISSCRVFEGLGFAREDAGEGAELVVYRSLL